MSPNPAASRPLESLKRVSGRVPLRLKLITAVLALVAIALAIISVAGIWLLRAFLLAPVDTQFPSTATVTTELVHHLNSGRGPVDFYEVSMSWLPQGGRLQQVVRPVQGPLSTRTPTIGGAQTTPPTPIPGPAIPTNATWLNQHTQQPVTVAATAGGGQWRVLAYDVQIQVISGGSVKSMPGIAVVGLNVTSQYQTLSRLRDVDLVVSAIVLVGLAVVGVAIVRTSLRPLTDIERTAERIASGELSQRVPDRDPRTEVGRLGRSLNAMLSQIETAFRARVASETAARRSEEGMRQFLADASHELRTPLTAIRGYAEYYRQRGGLAGGPGARTARPDTGARAAPEAGTDAGADAAPAADRATRANGAPGPAAAGADAAARRNGPGGDAAAAREDALGHADMDRIMRRVEQEAARMGMLVEDMLLLARLDQQRPVARRPVDLLTLAADAVQDARIMAPGRQIGLTIGSGGAFLVLGDEPRLRQVIGNLMSNALTHTPEETPVEVRIAAGAPASAGEEAGTPASAGEEVRATPPVSSVVLEVADSGPGLTPEQARHVFERFYRTDQARTRTRGGSGLGLAIVAALVAAHDGTATVESEPGRGTTFRITLPLAPEARED